jgi:hypothetical protein
MPHFPPELAARRGGEAPDLPPQALAGMNLLHLMLFAAHVLERGLLRAVPELQERGLEDLWQHGWRATPGMDWARIEAARRNGDRLFRPPVLGGGGP